LIELIFVMVILAIGAALVAPHMGGFFRGRVLNSEARRMLALVHLGQSRAAAEGVPILLWINSKDSTYGLRVQSSFVADDDRSALFTANEGVSLDTFATETAATSELDDEKLGMTDGLPVIRFNPDGFYDEISLRRVVFRLGTEQPIELAQSTNRLGYEIRAYTGN
jgi:Tfp pilus assembly protein FimT